MSNKNLKKRLERISSITKKMLITALAIASLLGIVLVWIFWQFASLRELSNKISLKEQELGWLLSCKEMSEESHNNNSYYNYEYSAKKGECPSDKNSVKNKDITSDRLKLCQEIKNDLRRLERKKSFFGKPERSAQQEYSEYAKNKMCPLDASLSKEDVLQFCQEMETSLINQRIPGRKKKIENFYKSYVEDGVCP